MKRRALVDVDALFREQRDAELAARERAAQQHLYGVELAVLNAMLTRYDFGLFEFVEADDFSLFAHGAVFGALRTLENAGREVDGEFLVDELRAELARQGKLDEEVLARVEAPPAHVVPAHDRVSIAYAIANLKAAAACRCGHTRALDVLECISTIRRREEAATP